MLRQTQHERLNLITATRERGNYETQQRIKIAT